MSVADFWEQVYSQLQLPFEYEDVGTITTEGDTTIIVMKDGSVYQFSIFQWMNA